jgi:Inhibitor of Apoptosis domain/Rap/ran-GAP/WW domain
VCVVALSKDFYNSRTKETSWSDPRMKHDVWEALVDDDSGQNYWYNKTTGVASWEEPEELRELRVVKDPEQSEPSGDGKSEISEDSRQATEDAAKLSAEVEYKARRARLEAMKLGCAAAEDYDGAIAAKMQLERLADDYARGQLSEDGLGRLASSNQSNSGSYYELESPSTTTLSVPSRVSKGASASPALPEERRPRTNSSSKSQSRRKSIRMAFSSLRPGRRRVVQEPGRSTITGVVAQPRRRERSKLLTSTNSLTDLLKYGAKPPPEAEEGQDLGRAPKLGELWDSVTRRKSSFDTFRWPLSNPSGSVMAEAGFFMLPPKGSRGDRAQCWQCGLTLSLWAEGDVPMDEHRKFRPNCAVVKGDGTSTPMADRSHSGVAINPEIQDHSSVDTDGSHLTDDLEERENEGFALSRNVRKWRTAVREHEETPFDPPEADVHQVFDMKRGYGLEFPHKGVPLLPDPEVFDQESYISYYTEFLGLIPHQNYVAGSLGHPFVISVEEHVGRARCLIRMPGYDLRVVVNTPSAKTSKKRAIREALSDNLSREIEFMTKYSTFAFKQKLFEFDKDFSLRRALKFGVLYCKPGQRTEREMLDNQEEDISRHFKRFTKWLGHSVKLEQHEGFRGGLDPRDQPVACYTQVCLTKMRSFVPLFADSCTTVEKHGNYVSHCDTNGAQR